jgi:hypothetical protein
LLHVNGFCEDQICADPEGLCHSRLPFHDGYRQRRLVVRRIARALEQQCGILFVIAIDDDCIEALAHQFLYGSKGLGAGNDREVELAENLRDSASGFLIGAE